MQLAVWTYEGPPHVGAMRVATAMEKLHYVLHAPQGDTYADLLFTMIERRSKRPPVTYTTFEARDLGKDTAQIFQDAAREAVTRFNPQAIIVGASCTAELIQDDPAGLSEAMGLPVPVIPLELPSYQRKENWGAAETFYQIVRGLADKSVVRSPREGRKARANILGPTALGFRHRDDLVEIRKILDTLGVEINLVAPLGATPHDIARIGEADFNIVMYPEIADEASRWLEKTFDQPAVRTVPIGVGATRSFIADVAELAGADPTPALGDTSSRMPWWSRSVDSTYLTSKRVFIFGDATHAVAAARIAREELGFEVCGLGCYNREFAREIRAEAARCGIEPLITGFPRTPLAPDGLRRRERNLRHLGAPAGDGPRRAPPHHVPRGFRIRRRARGEPPRRPFSAQGTGAGRFGSAGGRHPRPGPVRVCRGRRALDSRGGTRAEKDPLLCAR
jgi:light-independent protochlorophyllide reductase subunit B